MRSYFNEKGLTLIELIIVIVIIAIAVGIGYYAFQSRISHFRLRSSSREILEMMKLAQASAIRSNQAFRIFLVGSQTYEFQSFSAGLGGFTTIPSTEGRISQTINLANEIFFSPAINWPCTSDYSCFSPQFRADGTLDPSGMLTLTNGSEFFTVEWSVGGAIRIQ